MDSGCARFVRLEVLLISQGEQDLGLGLIGGRVDPAASTMRSEVQVDLDHVPPKGAKR